jgi:hypothetical protein
LPSYRLYRVDGAGKITSAEWLDAAHDEEVKRLARELVPDGMAEVWERGRLVARLGLDEESPGEGSPSD